MQDLSLEFKNFLLILMGAGIPILIKFTFWSLHTLFKKDNEITNVKNAVILEKINTLFLKIDEYKNELNAFDSKLDNLERIFLDYKTEKIVIDGRIKAYFDRVDEIKELTSTTSNKLDLFSAKFDERVVQLDDWKRSFDKQFEASCTNLETKARDNHYEIKSVNKKVYDLREKFIKSVVKAGNDVEFDADLWNDFAR